MKKVVALSGGKDSTAMALRLMEVEPGDYEYICTPTGDELPEMIDHWDRLEAVLGKPLKKLPNQTLSGLVNQMNMIPNFKARWCTRILKIEPFIEYMEKQPEGSVQFVGLRADEEARQGLMGEDFKTRYPLKEWGWGLKEVEGYLSEKGVCIPNRTDCARCFYQNIGEWYELWRDRIEIYMDASNQEDEIGHTWMTPGKHKIWPHKLSDLALEFEKGRKPTLSLKRMENKRKCRVCSM